MAAPSKDSYNDIGAYYDALDEYYTDNTVMPLDGRPGVFARQKAREQDRLIVVDELAAMYIAKKASAEHVSPAEIINGWVLRELASA